MVLKRSVTNTKKSKFGDNYEQIQFPNGEWYNVEKDSYIWAKWYNRIDNNGVDNKWWLININSELLKF